MGKLRRRVNTLALTVLVVMSFIAYGIVLLVAIVVAPAAALYYLVGRFGLPWYVGSLIGFVYVIWLNDRREELPPKRPAPRQDHVDAAHTTQKSPGLFTSMLTVGLTLLRYFTVLAAIVITLPLWRWLRHWWHWPSAVEVPAAADVSFGYAPAAPDDAGGAMGRASGGIFGGSPLDGQKLQVPLGHSR